MKISSNYTQYLNYSFNSNAKNNDKNPISTAGERATLLKTTVFAGLGFGALFLWEAFDDGSLIDVFIDKSEEIAQRNNRKSILSSIGIFGLITCGAIVGIAAIFTAATAPKVIYQGKVNSFVKGKDMDVYIKGNQVEKELYNQMNEKAKNATPEEKKVLAQQYLKLTAAKNEVPNSVKQNK